MQSLASDLQRLVQFEALPNESQCPRCLYFDTTHPDVQRILRRRDPKGIQNLERAARCKCKELAAEAEYRERMRWQQSGILERDVERSFANYTMPPGDKAMYNACRDVLNGNGPAVVVLTGPTGTGKSHLMEATVRATLTNGYNARYELAAAMVDRFRSTYDHDSQEDMMGLMSWYQGRHLLAIDDIGLERSTDFAQEVMTRLIEERIRHSWKTIVSTNLNREQMQDRMGDRLASRLYATNENVGVKLVVSGSGDYRAGNLSKGAL